jgi:hypothetical protein
MFITPNELTIMYQLWSCLSGKGLFESCAVVKNGLPNTNFSRTCFFIKTRSCGLTSSFSQLYTSPSPGFSSNITKLVSVKDLSMPSYNSHVCHMMMMVCLTITRRAIRSMRIKVLITHLCYFFNTVSQKVIGRKELDALKAYMIETMCMLEMCFPPFFDIQEHLMIHLVDEILTLGPLYLHSMFLYE